jgi:hypothetical protein
MSKFTEAMRIGWKECQALGITQCRGVFYRHTGLGTVAEAKEAVCALGVALVGAGQLEVLREHAQLQEQFRWQQLQLQNFALADRVQKAWAAVQKVLEELAPGAAGRVTRNLARRLNDGSKWTIDQIIDHLEERDL